MKEPKQDNAEKPRRRYESPALTRQGKLAETTAAAMLKTSPPPEKAVLCWVARAVYGEHDLRWLLFRGWMLDDAPLWLRRIYLRHGASFARIVALRPWLARALRRLMDRAIRSKYDFGSLRNE